MRGTLPAKYLRCPWRGIEDAAYARYHDEEWGVPLTDDRALFEKIVLEGFQSGLSWLTILRKRENFRAAFHVFQPDRIARYGAKDVARLMADAGIVRNRAKIEAAIDNAKAYLEFAERESFAQLIWSFAAEPDAHKPHRLFKSVPAESEQSRALSKRLKSMGFRFVGPTTMYAFMQSAGLVNDHLAMCHRHGACDALQRKALARMTAANMRQGGDAPQTSAVAAGGKRRAAHDT